MVDIEGGKFKKKEIIAEKIKEKYSEIEIIHIG